VGGVQNQQMHTDKIRFAIYHSPKLFRSFCDRHNGALREHRQKVHEPHKQNQLMLQRISQAVLMFIKCGTVLFKRTGIALFLKTYKLVIPAFLKLWSADHKWSS
jgi:hypothetical protein